MDPWRKRLGLIAGIAGIAACLAVLAAITWAVLYIHRNDARLERVPARIVEVVKSKRASFARSIKFGTYRLRIRYRAADGREVNDTIEKRTYGFPSRGDSITLLRDRESGHLEDSPFPELWIVLAVVYLSLGALIWMFVWCIRTVRAA
ncbi:MAG: hypothetical protein ACREP1_04955 [Rhodanobacteraceae bacterium]